MSFLPSPINIPLLTADVSELVLGALLQPTWGIYDSSGSPLIQPASFLNAAINQVAQPLAQLATVLGIPNLMPVSASVIEFDYAQDWPISDYPQENGAFQSYNKVAMPYDLKMRLASGGSISNRQAFISSVLSIASSFSLLMILTPEKQFTSASCTHIEWRRNAVEGNTLIIVDMWFRQVPVINATNFTNTQQPSEASQQGLGNVTPQSLSPSDQQSYNSLSID